MTVTEAQRLEMHLQLRKHLGDTVADTLVEHLPPTGWGDVARKSDIDHLDSRLRALGAGMWAMTSIFSACFIALFTLLVTQL